ncbi:MAG: DUF4347 domain-containing protein, partial [Burkholderiales bacterium]
MGIFRWLKNLRHPNAEDVPSATIEELEPRILYSADLNPLAAPAPEAVLQGEVRLIDGSAVQAPDASLAVVSLQEERTREIVFVDAAVADAETLVRDFMQGRPTNAEIEVVQITADADGLKQITGALAGARDVSAVHILSHGEAGALQLGNAVVDVEALRQQADSVATWRAALTEDADILLWGCSVGEGAPGQAFLRDLATATGADVAASVDPTGAALLGGDWDLQVSVGAIEALLASSQPLLDEWFGLLAAEGTEETATVRQEIVFIDASIENYQQLVASVSPNAEVVLLDRSQDGITQINQILAQEHGLAAIHIISHGADGAIEIGSTHLDATRLAVDAQAVARWGQALSADGDLLLYGCDVAQDATGQAFVQKLARLTGADVAASDDKTGHQSLGGDWTLEASTGVIEAGVIASPAAQADWVSLLGAPVTLSQRVAASSDDAEEEGPTGTTPNRMWLNSTDIELLSDFGAPTAGVQKVGLRFTGLAIPVGATITDAYLVFRAIAADAPMTNSDVTSLTLKGQLIGDAPTFTTTSGNISSRALTSASTAWAPSAWTSGLDYNSPNLSAVVQEIVNQGTWASGNNLAIIITGTGHRASQAFDTNPATAAQLVVTYTVNNAPVIANLAGDALVYAPGSGAIVIDQGTTASATDIDSADFNTGALTVSFAAGGVSTQDVLAIRNQGTGAGQIGVAGANVTYAGTTIGTWAGGSGGSNLVITLNANANTTNTAALLQNITYQNTDSVVPTMSARTVRFVLSDGDGGTSANYDTTVNVTSNTLAVVTTGSNAMDGDTSSIAALNANKGTDGFISLREAITAANNTAGADTIRFNIAGAGVQTIAPTVA